jgi:hypothetical protein
VYPLCERVPAETHRSQSRAKRAGAGATVFITDIGTAVPDLRYQRYTTMGRSQPQEPLYLHASIIDESPSVGHFRRRKRRQKAPCPSSPLCLWPLSDA